MSTSHCESCGRNTTQKHKRSCSKNSARPTAPLLVRAYRSFTDKYPTVSVSSLSGASSSRASSIYYSRECTHADPTEERVIAVARAAAEANLRYTKEAIWRANMYEQQPERRQRRVEELEKEAKETALLLDRMAMQSVV